MTEPKDRLENEALRLPARDRAHLARLLLESLDSMEEPAEVAKAWEAEVKHRVSEYRSGRLGTVTSAEVFQEARAQIRKKK